MPSGWSMLPVTVAVAADFQKIENRMTGKPSQSDARPSVIYDFGANCGLNLPYYFLKARKVVAVEANPALCAEMREQFSAQIRDGSLVIENCAIGAEGRAVGDVSFYLHKKNSVLSQMMPPAPEEANQFEEVRVEARSPVDLVRKHGEPLYVKTDVEQCDHLVLADLFAASIRPPFISAEAHSTDILYLLAHSGGYERFKLVRGFTVHTVFEAWKVNANGTRVPHDFPRHSAGPFGNDLPGRWIGAGRMFQRLVNEKKGWKDIHATTDESLEVLGMRDWVRAKGRSTRRWLRDCLAAGLENRNSR